MQRKSKQKGDDTLSCLLSSSGVSREKREVIIFLTLLNTQRTKRDHTLQCISHPLRSRSQTCDCAAVHKCDAWRFSHTYEQTYYACVRSYHQSSQQGHRSRIGMLFYDNMSGRNACIEKYAQIALTPNWLAQNEKTEPEKQIGESVQCFSGKEP